VDHLYIIWENRTGNMVGEFATELDAYSYVRQAISAGGREVAGSLLLTRELDDDDATSEFIAEGQSLIDNALASITTIDAAPPKTRRTA
jgi:hypothetical protein